MTQPPRRLALSSILWRDSNVDFYRCPQGWLIAGWCSGIPMPRISHHVCSHSQGTGSSAGSGYSFLGCPALCLQVDSGRLFLGCPCPGNCQTCCLVVRMRHGTLCHLHSIHIPTLLPLCDTETRVPQMPLGRIFWWVFNECVCEQQGISPCRLLSWFRRKRPFILHWNRECSNPSAPFQDQTATNSKPMKCEWRRSLGSFPWFFKSSFLIKLNVYRHTQEKQTGVKDQGTDSFRNEWSITPKENMLSSLGIWRPSPPAILAQSSLAFIGAMTKKRLQVSSAFNVTQGHSRERILQLGP